MLRCAWLGCCGWRQAGGQCGRAGSGVWRCCQEAWRCRAVQCRAVQCSVVPPGEGEGEGMRGSVGRAGRGLVLIVVSGGVVIGGGCEVRACGSASGGVGSGQCLRAANDAE